MKRTYPFEQQSRLSITHSELINDIRRYYLGTVSHPLVSFSALTSAKRSSSSHCNFNRGVATSGPQPLPTRCWFSSFTPREYTENGDSPDRVAPRYLRSVWIA